MVACAETLTAEDKVKGPLAHTDLRAGGNNIPNGTTDACWFGWQTMEERNSSNTATCQYVWGNYLDECIQINLLQPAGPQQLPIDVYYPLQDTLYRTMALANSSGTPVEAYDTDAYGNTIIFTGPGPDNTWFTDDDTQSSYGANNIIYCGYRYDAETENYYVRNRYYSPTLGRWLTRDPIGYRGGINLYGYVNSSPVGNVDVSGAVPLLIKGSLTGSLAFAREPGLSVSFSYLHGSWGGSGANPFGNASPIGPQQGDVTLSMKSVHLGGMTLNGSLSASGVLRPDFTGSASGSGNIVIDRPGLFNPDIVLGAMHLSVKISNSNCHCHVAARFTANFTNPILSFFLPRISAFGSAQSRKPCDELRSAVYGLVLQALAQ